MAAKIICMASAKGGSGKTILTATFGSFLSALGKRILLIDTDAATNGLTLLYLKEVMLQGEIAIAADREPRGIFEQPSVIHPAEIVTLKSGVQLIPATYSFINTDNVSANEFGESLREMLKLLRESYDYIFLDAQSGSDTFAKLSMSRTVSDEVVIVSEYDPMSAAGVERLKGLLREDLTYVRTWVLLNKLLPDFVQSFSDFLEVAKYLNPIPWDADVVKAYARRRLALDLENGNEHTLAVMQTLRTLFGEGISSELDTWTKGRAAAIRQPLADQYKDAEKQLEALVGDRYRAAREIERRHFRRSFIPLFLFSAVAFGVVAFGHSLGVDRFGLSVLSEAIFIILAGAVVSFMGILDVFTRKTPEIEIEEGRAQRRQAVLEEKLKKLEALKAADLETLIKSQRSIT
jgi:cellulose biosynthesis protein BcsQ